MTKAVSVRVIILQTIIDFSEVFYFICQIILLHTDIDINDTYAVVIFRDDKYLT